MWRVDIFRGASDIWLSALKYGSLPWWKLWLDSVPTEWDIYLCLNWELVWTMTLSPALGLCALVQVGQGLYSTAGGVRSPFLLGGSRWHLCLYSIAPLCSWVSAVQRYKPAIWIQVFQLCDVLSQPLWHLENSEGCIMKLRPACSQSSDRKKCSSFPLLTSPVHLAYLVFYSYLQVQRMGRFMFGMEKVGWRWLS